MIRIGILSFLLILTTKTMAQPDFYHLSVNSENIKFTCYLNGFPVYASEDEYDAIVSLPVQLFLVGKNNTLKIEAEAYDKSKPGILEADVAPFSQGEMVDTGGIDAKLSMEVTDMSSKEMTFDNERFDFSDLLLTGDQLKEADVKAFGKKLYGYLVAGDAKGFVGEMAVKIRDYAATNPYTEEQMREGLTQQLQQTFFSQKHDAVADDQISVVSYSDGRIWEIKIRGEEFLKYNEDGGSMQMPVYVGSVKGKLSIVR
ncbi:hypothetical protein [Fulvivirga lutimaris]|uniref:hypothetical protein n=1 Tax=Fulvivirga lutimaris TaxID=1819566 RepID=UPI0012BB8759|nr:hypothetical protein [Fulvivirga lutimaris]MTI38125.1 hypothetical protein [Fulvivirga lutimaris]